MLGRLTWADDGPAQRALNKHQGGFGLQGITPIVSIVVPFCGLTKYIN